MIFIPALLFLCGISAVIFGGTENSTTVGAIFVVGGWLAMCLIEVRDAIREQGE